MLLNVVKGPTSFTAIKSFGGVTCARGMLDGDKEWLEALEETSQWATAGQLRHLFVTLIIFPNR